MVLPKIFCLTGPKNFVRVPFCFTEFLVSKKIMDKKEGGREYHDFLSKIFCLTVPKIFVGELFCAVSENFRQPKSLWIRGGGGGENQEFPSKIFCLTGPKNLIGEPFCAVFQKISGSEKVYG